MDGTDPEGALIGELRTLAKADSSSHDFELTWDGLRVSVSYVSGSGNHVMFKVGYDTAAGSSPEASYRDGERLLAIRPMKVELRPEAKAHVEGKAGGMDVEHQTGDAQFDQRVYINAPTPDPLPQLFKSATVRTAVLDLFELNFKAIDIDDDKGLITAYATSFPDLRQQTGTPGRNALTAFVRLAKALPRVTARAGVRHPADALGRTSTWLFRLALVLFLIGVPVSCLSLGKECEEDVPASKMLPCVVPGLLGFVLAVVVTTIITILTRPALKARYAGTPTSSNRIDLFTIALGLVVLIVVMCSSATLFAQLWQHH